MKIDSKYINGLFCSLITASCGIAIYSVVKDTKDYKSINDLKKEISQKAPQLYDSLMNDGVSRHTYSDWKYEANRMNDSIKTDSMIQRAYFEGAQMVRDSIKNAEGTK